MEHFNVEVKDVESQLEYLAARFPSLLDMALIHDAEQKVKAAQYMWNIGRQTSTTSLLADACLDLYNLVEALGAR